MAPLLTVTAVSKSYPGLPVLKEASFAVEPGEIICLLGPSGCGKTTLLRIVAGLETSDTGTVIFAGRDVHDIPVHRRNFGFMFQDYALFPHKDVAANVAFGLRMQGLPQPEIAGRVKEMLSLVALDGYERRRVVELSGGEQQRVALARSLAPRPQLLMLDEPLGALDRSLREQLMNELRTILKRVGVTALYVTHDQEEAFAVSDRVLIMRARPEQGEGGWIEQEGTPDQVYRHPSTEYVARFLGFRNLLPGRILGTDTQEPVETLRAGALHDDMVETLHAASLHDDPARGYRVETAAGTIWAADAAGGLPAGADEFAAGDAVILLVRPEAADVRPPGEQGENLLQGRLIAASFRGSYYLIQTEHAGGVTLICEASTADVELPFPGDPLTLRLDPTAVTLMRPQAAV